MSERVCKSVVFMMYFLNKTNSSTSDENLLDTGHLNHPFEVWWEDSVLDKPARQLVPLSRVAAIDGEARLGILVLGILKVTGYFLGQIRSHVDNLWRKYVGWNPCEFHDHFVKNLTLIMVAKYSPLMWFSVFRYRSRSSLAPTGLYLALNLSKRWKVCLPFKYRSKKMRE